MMGRPANQLPLFTKKELKTNAPAAALPPPGWVAITGRHSLDLYQGISPGRTYQHSGQSFTAVASSYTHFYVSTTNSLHSYNLPDQLPAGEYLWSRGGQNPPAIGPKGHVYAIADNKVYVFPPPKPSPFDNVVVYQPGSPNSGAGVDASGNATATSSGPTVMQPALPITPMGQPASQTPQAQSQRFQPPMTTNGNRLFACENLDGDDCGKGDHKAISLAFCQAQGYARATDYDVDSRKVPAETLSGQFCSKNKCKVFDTIECGQ